jgi:subtilisin-like proprotein convertase family protein
MATFVYSNNAAVYVKDNATAHNSVDVYGLGGTVKQTSITINDLSHEYPNDFDMLLVAPDGQHNIEFMSDTGGMDPVYGVDLTFSDFAVFPLTTWADGFYLPTELDIHETAANWGLNIPQINHGGTFASAFGGINGEGNWSLYTRDDGPGDTGGYLGWNLTITTDVSASLLNGGNSDDFIRVLPGTKNGEGIFEINERGAVSYAGVYSFDIDGNGGNDLILTGGESDRISGGIGRDSIHAGGAYDTIYINKGEDVAGETYDGGGGDDFLIHTDYETLNLRDDTFKSIERLVLQKGGKVLVTAVEANGLTSVQGANDITHPDEFAVNMVGTTYLDLDHIVFTAFEQSGDRVTVKGTDKNEAIIGSKVNDFMSLGGGKDYVITGLGRDTIDGGKGSDTVDYTSRSLSVTVTLKAGVNTGVKIDGVLEDTIKNVENITGGTIGDVLKGDGRANALTGMSGADVLQGGGGNDKLYGGLGLDTVSGGAGKDQFIFGVAIDVADHIKDFSHADDTIVLYKSAFSAFSSTGVIASKAFHAFASGHAAQNADQHLLYDKSKGGLWYDADGNGAGAAVLMATLDNKPQNLDFHDFQII